eukprot:CCRYP_003072-RA/>CCRYP_003072-RA protein AED:0.00 eAED:0.00 QI:276/1/1/1/0/0/2/257/142
MVASSVAVRFCLRKDLSRLSMSRAFLRPLCCSFFLALRSIISICCNAWSLSTSSSSSSWPSTPALDVLTNASPTSSKSQNSSPSSSSAARAIANAVSTKLGLASPGSKTPAMIATSRMGCNNNCNSLTQICSKSFRSNGTII